MNAKDTDAELQEVLSNLFDGRLKGDDRTRLQERLRNDPEARELYLDLCDTHAALAWEHGLLVASVDPPAGPRRSLTDHRRRARYAAAVGVLLCVSMVLIAVVLQTDGEKAGLDGPTVARVTDRIDAVGTANEAEWTGDVTLGGEYGLERGLVRLAYPSGVSVLIEAPARFAATAEDRILLHEGRLSATVTPEGSGFTVETPTATVVDFGTEFAVDVDREERSEVHVFEGHVRVEPKRRGPQSPAASVDLRTDQAVRIDGTSPRAAGIDLASDRFIRSLDEPQPGYAKRITRLRPVVSLRMPIRHRGLVGRPPEFSGRVLYGDGRDPAWGPGRIGGALRVGGRSVGRGAVVDEPIPLDTGKLSVVVWVQTGSRPADAVVATDFGDGDGRFALSLDASSGAIRADVRGADGAITTCRDGGPLPLDRWHHVAMTADGVELKLYLNGELAASTDCPPIGNDVPAHLWIGVDASGTNLWDGRIDELALFDKALSAETIRELHDAAK